MKKKSNKINFKSNSSRAIYNYVLENNYKITVKQACDELAVTPSQVYSLIGLLRKKGMNVRVIRKSVERQIYREARQYIEEHNCEISIAKACRDLNVSREQLNNMTVSYTHLAHRSRKFITMCTISSPLLPSLCSMM